MSLWSWSVAAWESADARQALLTLQDDAGQCIPLLLWGAWSACEGRELTEPVVAEAIRRAVAWSSVTIPLRSARRALGDLQAPTLKQEVQAVELAVERALLLALEPLNHGTHERPLPEELAGAMERSMALLSSRWTSPAPPEGVRAAAFALEARLGVG